MSLIIWRFMGNERNVKKLHNKVDWSKGMKNKWTKNNERDQKIII